MLDNFRVRKSLRTGVWSQADRKRWGIEKQWDEDKSISKDPDPKLVTVEQAWDELLRDLKARGRQDSTLYKYQLLFAQMTNFARANRLRFLAEFNVPTLRKFRESWPNQNFAAQKKLEHLRSFFRFAQASGWIADNPAAKLQSHKTRRPQVLPFTREEVARIWAACDAYGTHNGRAGREYARRLRGLALLLRYSGLRIGDVVSLERGKIAEGKLFLCTAKTGTEVYCPLPDFVLLALASMPSSSGKYFFWTGQGKLKSAVGDWQRSLKKLFRLAKVSDGHAHRFRHTFSVELLLAGVPIERVSILLGHSSVRITEKYYAAWVRERQEQLEADVRRSWSVLPAESGTNLAHAKSELVN